LLLAAGAAHAHCGSAFCLVNTSWDVQGLWVDPGSRLDLRYEFVDQDTMKHGSGAGEDEEEAHPHEPLRTLNRVTSVSFDHSFNREFGVSVIVPWVARIHDELTLGAHAHVHTTAFSRLGDVRVLGRWQFAHDESVNWGLRFGAKLASGDTDVPGPHGGEFDRNLQPGTGTTDAIVGLYANGKLGADAGWFAQATAQSALAQHDGYAPGDKLQLDGGVSRTLGAHVLGLLQVNISRSGRDRGIEAAPDDTGARSVSVSPGVNVVLAPNANLYAFVERPLWRRVNGEQLVADWAAALGFNWAF
jgi:hypothetical protein